MKRAHFSFDRTEFTEPARHAGFLRRTARAVYALAALATLGGCGSSAPLFAPDGRPTTQVQCSAAGTWDACMQQARGMCGGNFDVVRQSTSSGVHTLLFACKGS